MNMAQILEILSRHAPHLAPRCNEFPNYMSTFKDGGEINANEPDGPWELYGQNLDIWYRGIETEDDLIKALKDYVPRVALDYVEKGRQPILPTVIGNFFYSFLYHTSWKLHGMPAGSERQVLADKVIAFLDQDTNPPGFHQIAYGYFNTFRLEIA